MQLDSAPQARKFYEKRASWIEIFFEITFVGRRAVCCPPPVCGRNGPWKDGGRRERKEKKHTKKGREKRKKAFCMQFNSLGCSNPEREEKVRRKLGGGKMAGERVHKNEKIEFFFEIFVSEIFTLRTLSVLSVLNRSAFDVGSSSESHILLEASQDGSPHKKWGGEHTKMKNRKFFSKFSFWRLSLSALF